MPDIAFDVETYEEKEGKLKPILDGTGKYFLVGTVTDNNQKTRFFRKKKEMWEYILKQGEKARTNGKVIYAHAHNIKYDFFNIFRPNRNLVVLNEFPFVASYFIEIKTQKTKQEWVKYKKYLKMNGIRYSKRQEEDKIEVTILREAVRFVDTLSIFKMSLKKLGNLVGKKKLEMPKEITKENIKEVYPYVKRDTEILIQAIKMLKNKIKEDGVNIKRIVTMNQVAISYLIKMMMEEIKEEDYDKVFKGKGLELIQSKCRRKIRKAYRGGRVEAWKTGIIKKVSSIDCNSLYPYSATKIRFPDLKSEVYWNRPKKESWQKLLKKIGITRAVMYNKNNELGLLPVRLPTLSYFPKKGKYLIGTWTNGEILKAIKEGYKIIDIQFIVTYDEIDNPFEKIMPKIYKLRKDKSIGDFNNVFYKSIMVGGIGKFAQTKVGGEIVFDSIENAERYKEQNYEILGGVNDTSRIMKYKKKTKSFKYKKYYCPIIPALITAEARMYMYDFYKLIGKNKLLYTDTDSIIFKGKVKNLTNKIKIGDELGEFKVEYEGKEFECWGRKCKRIEDEITMSGITKNKSKKYDKRNKTITFTKMQGLGKDDTGRFIEETRSLERQFNEYLTQERILSQIDIFIENSILKDVDGGDDGRGKDDIIYFKDTIRKINKKLEKRRYLKGGTKVYKV